MQETLQMHHESTVSSTPLTLFVLSIVPASNMLVLSDGSDMMGSLRNPAGWNNLYSIRPTAEWMKETIDGEADDSAESDIELPYPTSTVGPMARCPEDLAMFLETIFPEEQRTDFDASAVIDKSLEDLNLLVKRSKIGWLADWGGSLPFEDGVLPHCKRSLDLFESNSFHFGIFRL